MPKLLHLFPTRFYRADLGLPEIVEEIERACRVLEEEDEAGQTWCEEHDYLGYTSYASLDDLPWRFPIFKDLVKILDKNVANFAKTLEFDLQGGKLELDSLWVNILPEGGSHAAHIHPHSTISGTFYIAVPEGAQGLRLEDPRHAMMMAAPPKREDATQESQPFVTFSPKVGTLFLWESWLRHDVPVNRSEEDRISVSFNYSWV